MITGVNAVAAISQTILIALSIAFVHRLTQQLRSAVVRLVITSVAINAIIFALLFLDRLLFFADAVLLMGPAAIALGLVVLGS